MKIENGLKLVNEILPKIAIVNRQFFLVNRNKIYVLKFTFAFVYNIFDFYVKKVLDILGKTIYTHPSFKLAAK